MSNFSNQETTQLDARQVVKALHWQRLKARVTSSEASVRTSHSGGSEDNSLIQQASEIKKVQEEHKKKLLNMAGCATPVFVSPRKSVALKTHLGLSKNKHRQQKRVYRSLGIDFASEAREAEQQKKALFGKVIVEKTNLVFVNDEKNKYEREAPVAKVENLLDLVKQLLDQYDKEEMLTWHNSQIPEDEVWLKIGGDHGGGSFKLMLQIANLQNPNSEENTCLLAIVNCKDTPTSLWRILSPFKQQIADLQAMAWRDKRIKLFLFGDYDFFAEIVWNQRSSVYTPLSVLYSIKKQIQKPLNCNQRNIKLQTLKKLKFNNKRYRRVKKKIAKLDNNVIHRPMVKLELSQVAPPYLHNLLGIVKKHHTLLETASDSINKKIAKTLINQKRTIGAGTLALNSFVEKRVEQLNQLEEESRHIETELSWNKINDHQSLGQL